MFDTDSTVQTLLRNETLTDSSGRPVDLKPGCRIMIIIDRHILYLEDAQGNRIHFSHRGGRDNVLSLGKVPGSLRDMAVCDRIAYACASLYGLEVSSPSRVRNPDYHVLSYPCCASDRSDVVVRFEGKTTYHKGMLWFMSEEGIMYSLSIGDALVLLEYIPEMLRLQTPIRSNFPCGHYTKYEQVCICIDLGVAGRAPAPVPVDPVWLKAIEPVLRHALRHIDEDLSRSFTLSMKDGEPVLEPPDRRSLQMPASC